MKTCGLASYFGEKMLFLSEAHEMITNHYWIPWSTNQRRDSTSSFLTRLSHVIHAAPTRITPGNCLQHWEGKRSFFFRPNQPCYVPNYDFTTVPTQCKRIKRISYSIYCRFRQLFNSAKNFPDLDRYHWLHRPSGNVSFSKLLVLIQHSCQE